METHLIVARMQPGEAAAVAEIFAESDAGELPHMVGISRRSLFEFHKLYLHVLESKHDITNNIIAVRDNPLFEDVNRKLARFISPFDPATWRGPKDAMARRFYAWEAR